MIPDFLACFPFNYVTGSYDEETESGGGGGGSYNNLIRLIRLPRLYRLVRISKLGKLLETDSNETLTRIIEVLSVKQAYSRMGGMILSMLV
jgi:hypothetical protein